MTDPIAPYSDDDELRAHVGRALSATYELEQEIGRGGMGIVYRARDRRLKRAVAIKVLPPELSFRRDVRSRFLREAETAAQLSHPNIVPIYSVDELGHFVFFVMACIDGDNLATRLAKRGPLPIDEVRRWLYEVSEALAYAHAHGVVHRDIKPDNILLDSDDGRALVTDFGIARAASESGETSRLTATGVAIGTPTYMSPEQASGDRDLDARSDLYSLGVVAYQMLCGEPPFVGNTTPALLVKHLTEVPPHISQRRPDVPSALAAIVMRLLEKNPDHRLQSAGELSMAIRTGQVPPMPPGVLPNERGLLAGTPGSLSQSAGSRQPSVPGQYEPPPYQSNTVVSAPAYDSRTQAGFAMRPAWQAPLLPGAGTAAGPADTGDVSEHITAEEWERFEHPAVRAFRRKFAIYLIVNVPMIIAGILGGRDFWGMTTLWTIYIAWKYAQLWSDDFDWHDVLRQPRNRVLGEVLEDVGNSIMSTFSRKKREELRLQGKLRSPLRGALRAKPLNRPGIPQPAAGVPESAFGPQLEPVRAIRANRDEVLRLLATLPGDQRSMVPDVSSSVEELTRKAEQLAVELARTQSESDQGRLSSVEQEIADLEAAANPLDKSGSDNRVRRLATLRRERRALSAAATKIEKRLGQLDEIRIAIESIRVDLVQLRTGNSSMQSVTLLAEQAMKMAREVEIAVQAAAEVNNLTSAKPAG